MDDFTPPPYLPLKPKPSGGKCSNNECFISIESAAQGAKENGDKILKEIDRRFKQVEPYLNFAGQLADLALLKVINDKLGPKVKGGISGKLTKMSEVLDKTFAAAKAASARVAQFAKWARLGQLMNLITMIATIHNVVMLSRNVGETFLSMLSNGLAMFGLKDDEGNAYNLSQLIGKTVEDTVKDLIGAQNYTTLSENWKKANRIYQASANLLFSIQSLRFSVMSALETIGSWNARIGNALRKWGVVGEGAYPWMNVSPNFDNRFTRALERVEDVTSQIDSVSSEVLSAQETVTQIGQQKDELLNSLGLGTEKPMTENQPKKAEQTAAKAASASPDINADDLIKPGV